MTVSLLPPSSVCNYFTTPLWVNVPRSIWVLFFLATPVWLFVDDIFHRKVITEIVNLWWCEISFSQWFLKFGSMNLLVYFFVAILMYMSLGTSIAYLSSIALLVLASKDSSDTTYFDSVVFLSFFCDHRPVHRSTHPSENCWYNLRNQETQADGGIFRISLCPVSMRIVTCRSWIGDDFRAWYNTPWLKFGKRNFACWICLKTGR